jgi:hypothetical protein
MDYLIKDIDAKPLRIVTNVELCPRDLLFYLWLTHYRPVSSGGGGEKLAPQARILAWIGEGMKDTIDAVISADSGDLHGIVSKKRDADGEQCYAISSDHLSQIGQSLEEHYHILQPLPGVGLTGRDYVRYINRNPARTDLRDQIAEGLRELFKGARGAGAIQIDTLNNEVIQISAGDRSWVFLILIHATERALTFEYMRNLLPVIDAVRAQVARNFQIDDPATIQVLLLAPDSADVEAARAANNAPRVYHLWALATVRFFHLLNELLTSVDPIEIAGRLDNIFPTEVVSAISDLKMIERLKQTDRLHPPKKK